MRNTYIVVSNLVDELIQELLPDSDIMLFPTLSSLLEYTDTAPIRGVRLYITREAIQLGGVRNSLEALFGLLKTPMLKVDEVAYITEENSPEVKTIEYYLQEKEVSNWELKIGDLTREYVTEIICGNIDNDKKEKVNRRSIYRVRKSDYVQNKLLHPEILQDHYESEEETLGEIDEDITRLDMPVINLTHSCEVVNVAGLQCKERTIFAFLLAQYCALKGKTIIVESDFSFLTLSDMVARAGKVKLMYIDIVDFYEDYLQVFEKIKTCPENLIVITASQRASMNYQFIFQIIQSSLANDIEYMIKETDVKSMQKECTYNIVFPNNTVDILKTVDELPISFNKANRYVGVDIMSIRELVVTDSEALRALIREVLDYKDEPNVSVVQMTSLILGGETHDLRMYIESN